MVKEMRGRRILEFQDFVLKIHGGLKNIYKLFQSQF